MQNYHVMQIDPSLMDTVEDRPVASLARFNGYTDNMSNYSHVASIMAYDLDEVFEIGNVGPEHRIARFAQMSSISVGDVIYCDGVAHAVEAVGFKTLSQLASNRAKHIVAVSIDRVARRV